MSQDHTFRNRTESDWSSADLEHGVIDLYARRVQLVKDHEAAIQQRELERRVVTKPFGRPFTAQPSYPPDELEQEREKIGGLAGLRRRLTSAAAPARKLATS